MKTPFNLQPLSCRIGQKACQFFFILLFLTTPLLAVPPKLTPQDVVTKTEEIFKAHAAYKAISTQLLERAFENFLDEIDPFKTYLLEKETTPWSSPSKELLEKTLKQWKEHRFDAFYQIYALMPSAIERRRSFEEQLKTLPIIKKVKASEFKNPSWAPSEKALLERLLRIKSFQTQAIESLKPEDRNLFFQRIAKRRIAKEEEFLEKNPKTKDELILSCILKAVAAACDSQTAYFTPREADQFMMHVQQKLFGIGVLLQDDLNGFKITQILEGGPAALSRQIEIGDRIVAIEGEPVIGLEITDTIEKIRGPEGSSVKLTLLREDSPLDIVLQRKEIILQDSRLEVETHPFGSGTIGVLKLHSFYQDEKSSSADDLKKAILNLKEKNVQGIILDLRKNGGGVLSQAVAVSSLFMKKGVVVSVKDHTGAVQHLRNLQATPTWEGPLVILTSRATASNAEIITQTLKEYGIALVVGDITYGKGTFQSFTLDSSNHPKVNPKGEYKVTRGKFYTVSGQTPQLKGVLPHLIVPSPLARMEVGEKYAKYPLEPDSIPPSFNDTLEDIPIFERYHISKLYSTGKQPLLDQYSKILPILQKNSSLRMKANKNFALFTAALEEENEESHTPPSFGISDLQLSETLDIMKDLILLNNLSPKEL